MVSPRPLDHLRAWLPNRARLAPVGIDGWLSLGLAGVVILASAGLSLLFCFWHCARIALKAPIAPDGDGVIVVLGARPDAEGITAAFKLRLRRAMTQPGDRQIFILGGATGNMACSEAELASAWFAAQGVGAERLVLDTQSRNTRENFANLGRLLRNQDRRRHILITSRAHLARSLLLARYFGLRMLPCGAEERFRWHAKSLFWLLREALYLNWLLLWRLCFPARFCR